MIRWLDARDEFLGIGNVGNYIGHTTPDLVYALDQIRTLINEGFELEEANWLVSLFKENEMVTTEIAAARFKVLIEENPNDARVLCYYGILVNEVNWFDFVLRSHNLGFPLATGVANFYGGQFMIPKEAVKVSADKGDRYCQYIMGISYSSPDSCSVESLNYLKRAMESGHWTATAYYVQYTKSLLDPQLFTTLGRLFSKCASAQILFSKNCKSVVNAWKEQKNTIDDCPTSKYFGVIVAIGHVFIHDELPSFKDFDSTCLEFVSVHEKARMAINAWKVCARKIGFHKDLISTVSKHMWK